MIKKNLLGYLLAVIIALLWACQIQCNSNDSLKGDSTVETKTIERENERKEEKRLSVVHDTLVQYRDRIKTRYEKVLEYVLVMDTVETDKSFDSLQLTKKGTVVMAYELQSLKEQKVVSDSVDVVQNVRIGLLTESNLKADTLLIEADKRAKKGYFRGLKHGFVAGAAVGFFGTAAVVK